MKSFFLVLFLSVIFLLFVPGNATAKAVVPSFSPTPIASPSATPTEIPTVIPLRSNLTTENPQTVEPLQRILESQKVESVFPFNFIKVAIRNSVGAGVPVNTLVLILLLPLVASVIAATRQLVGLRGFGIFLPASLSVVFVATGPIVGIIMFLIIVFVSTAARMILRKFKIKLQYLPRMALILWAVSVGVLGVLFLTPIFRFPGLTNVSIFAVLILALLTEDFIRIQLGKSVKTAIRLTYETIILSIISYLFLTYSPIQTLVLLNPEAYLLFIVIFDVILGRYTGLRVMELWRFRKLIRNK